MSGKYPKEPIAIVGSACRFPGECSSPSKLWDLYRQPRDVLREIPPSRFNAAKFYHPDPLHHGTSNVRHSYTLAEDHRVFDAQFFGVKPVEANAMDPQQRILLEVTYEALESAGLPMEKVQGSTMGVFVGIMSADYGDRLPQDIHSTPTYFASGTARSTLSNRVSYVFDFHGPSMTIDTACSSSLVALHQAVQSLRSGESCGAIVAGTNLLLGPEPYVAGAKLNMLSPSGRSRMWDKDADGYGRGDGFGVLVVKTLSQALADHDTIECIIRETGVNQDGRTKGITMPSSLAQARLIRSTYAKAGLDIAKASDRPQYFEAHGTGTAAGDPMEAEAISNVFFGRETQTTGNGNPHTPLYVGSGKTILGHAEGAAGVAGVLRAALAIKNAAIPPNMLLNEISSTVQPFYNKLRIVKEAKKWPQHEGGRAEPRRASVNSFGFGGTNAHAILESYDSEGEDTHTFHISEPMMPFNFSAGCEQSLLTTLSDYASFLRTTPSVNLHDLAWTLGTRRSILATRRSISALNHQDLIEKLEKLASNGQKISPGEKHSTTRNKNPQILAIFTGQGAQWATMGSCLLQSESLLVTNSLRALQESLNTLPAHHAPSWWLEEELRKPPETSRIQQGEISQPLCTAIQILLVDLLRAARVNIASVIGHSSGEIAAVYAAGYISAADAIRIAYYRGYFTNTFNHPDINISATETDKVTGAMLAAGMTSADAEELCGLPSLDGRICIAARNSPTSITLSGDTDAIEEAMEILQDEDKFARRLKVDMAYHSHHMLTSAFLYVGALKSLDIQIQTPPSHQRVTEEQDPLPVWISTVTGECVDTTDQHLLQSLKTSYWADNMTKPVLFSDAVQYAVESSRLESNEFDAIIEVGPHPALKKPTLEVIQWQSNEPEKIEIPYIPTLSRNHNDITSFASSLGTLWTLFGPSAVNLHNFHTSLYGPSLNPKLVKNLPTYTWLHDRQYWHESRLVTATRMSGQAPNMLIGTASPDSTANSLQFRNFLSPRKIPWLAGHCVHGQIVFPAAGYVAAALEAVYKRYRGEVEDGSVEVVEIEDLVIRKAVAFKGEDLDVEVVVTLTRVEEEKVGQTNNAGGERRVVFLFHFYSDAGGGGSVSTSAEVAAMTENASGRVIVVLRDRHELSEVVDPLPLPHQQPAGQRFLDVNRDEFYSWAREIGFQYDGDFVGLTHTRRRLDEATGRIKIPRNDTDEGGYSTPLLLHPAILDCAIQAMLLAYCYPGDGRMRSLHMPTRIERFSIDLGAFQRETGVSTMGISDGTRSLPLHATVSSLKAKPAGGDIVGDAQVYSSAQDRTLIQLQGLNITPLVPATDQNDVQLLLDMTWGPERPTSGELTWDEDEFLPATANDDESLATLTERVAFFYLRKLAVEFPLAKRADMDLALHHTRLLEYIDHVVASVADGRHPYVPATRAHDEQLDTITNIISRYPSSIDLKTIRAIGEGLIPAIRGHTNILEVMRQDNMMDEFYARSLGMPKYLDDMARTVGQLSHRFPRMNILEIGAGSGATTASMVEALGSSSFSSYTFTDISSGYFAKAQGRFKDVSRKMQFRVFDIEKDILDQGYTENSYDLVVASLVLHATQDLTATMARVRKLLRPGGYLVILEVTNNDSLRVGLVSGGLPGWWLGGEQDGRVLSPCVSAAVWEETAVGTGFSALEASTPHDARFPVPLSVLVFQAVNERVAFLRAPFSTPVPVVDGDGGGSMKLETLTIVGGTAEVVEQLRTLLKPFYRWVRYLPSLEDIISDSPTSGNGLPTPTIQGGTLLTLVGLLAPNEPHPLFQNMTMTATTLQALQQAFRQNKSILWVTSGAQSGSHPYNNLLVGMQRSIALEMVDVRSRVLDFDSLDDAMSNAELIAKKLLQIEFEGVLQEKKQLEDLLWYSEPEQLFPESQGGEMRAVVPRVHPSKRRNERYNSARRVVTRDVAVGGDTILSVIRQPEGGYYVSERVSSPELGKAKCDSPVAVRLSHSLLQPVRVTETSTGFLSLGEVEHQASRGSKKKQLVIVLSDGLDSRVIVPACWVLEIPADMSIGGALKALWSLHVHMLARHILAQHELSAGAGTLVVLNPDYQLGQALCALSEQQGEKVLLLVSARSGGLGESHKTEDREHQPPVFLHPRSTSKSIERILAPMNISTFVNMGESTSLLASIHIHLPSSCRKLNHSDLVAVSATLDLSITGLYLEDVWPKSLKASMETSDTKVPDQPPLTINDLTRTLNASRQQRQVIISWPISATDTLCLPVYPATEKVHFSPDKTYWLSGLTGDLGLSLCEWMAGHGARYIALSSRNPNIDDKWVDLMGSSYGCTVKVLSGHDATDRQSVRQIYHFLTKNMPPIAGIAQGAMVLHDTVFPDLDTERLNKVLKPKVQGSLYLDELFPDNTLEFFVFFSSLAYVVGNRGQSAYTAANAFMASLAANRRRRGLAGSVINLGAIVGPGYVSRELTPDKRAVLNRSGFAFISEQDFYEVFAEGVLASRPQGKSEFRASFEISAGLQVAGDDDDLGVDGGSDKTFASNPIFQHLMSKQPLAGSEDRESAAHGGRSTGRSMSATPLKTMLAKSISEEEGSELIRDDFIAKLEATLALQVQLDNPDRVNMITSKSPDQLGIDSLVAVDIQSWFRKELSIDMPVMKILNAPTIQHLLSSSSELFYMQRSNWSRKGGQETIADITVAHFDLRIDGTGSDDSSSLSSPSMRAPTHISSSASTTSSSTHPALLPSGSISDCSETDISTPSEAIIHDQDETLAMSSTSTLQRTAPMSFAQSRFWFLKFLVQDQSAFNITTLIRLNGQIDITRLERAFVAVGQRHEAIRTIFYTDKGTKQHTQGVLPAFPSRLEHSVLSDGSQVEAHVHKEVDQIRHHEYDLSSGESVRLRLLTIESHSSPTTSATWTHYLVLGYHHIVMDGISQQIFLSDLAKAYDMDQEFNSPRQSLYKAPKALQYPDFTLRQIRELEQDSWAKQLEYWATQFQPGDLPPKLPVISTFTSSRSKQNQGDTSNTIPTFSSHISKAPITASLKAQIDQTCRQYKVAPSHFYLAVFRVFLFRHIQLNTHDKDDSDQNTDMDIAIGTADAGRKDPDVLDSLGLFLNLLPLRFRQTTSSMQFNEVLSDVKLVSDLAFANSRVPIDVILEKLAARGGNPPPRGGLFQAFLNYRPPGIQNARQFLGCEAQGELISAGGSSYDISVDVLDSDGSDGGETVVAFAVNTEVYTADEAEGLRRSYFALLGGFAGDAEVRIDEPGLFMEGDVKMAVEGGRGEESVSVWGECGISTVVHRVDEMVGRYGGRVALTGGDGGGRLTYGEMARRVNQLALYLGKELEGVGSPRVGILQAPGVDWVCSLLAVLRIGATCVPLDMQVGPDRFLQIAKGCLPRCILVDGSTNDILASPSWEDMNVLVLDVSSIDRNYHSGTDTLISIQASPSSTAIITYTSGSTGTPKGVAITHASYRNFLEFTPPRWGVRQGQETILQQSSFVFDMSIGQILTCLAYGGTLAIADSVQRRDPAAICQIMTSQGVTFTLATPTEYMAWIRIGGARLRNSPWRGAMSGGEAMTESLVQSFRTLFVESRPQFCLINSYGPCETTFACADAVIPLHGGNDGFSVSTIPNCSVRIVDDNLQPVPAGVLGQVVIGGAGVAAGYLSGDGRGRDAFPPCKQPTPFFKHQGWMTEHLSGDCGRMDKSGRLTIQGRVRGQSSTQIKMGGIRMDLEEIEHAILKTMGPYGVAEAVVSHRSTHQLESNEENVSSSYLVAFVVLSNGADMDRNEMEILLKTRILRELPLPQYMRPSLVVSVDAIPRTLSNKVDRAKVDVLPLHTGMDNDNGDIHKNNKDAGLRPPSTEQALLALWKELLPSWGTTSTSTEQDVDFFHAGGNSLALLNLQALIRDRLNIDVSIAELFGSTSLGRMARLLDEKTGKMQLEGHLEPEESTIIDWDLETAINLDSDSSDTTPSNSSPPRSAPQVIAMTGSTGFLGREILHQLFNNPHITHIHCLAVRSPSQHDTDPKITIHQGNLTLPNLGLSPQDAISISSSVDAIIHVGADVSFLKSYHNLRSANVGSTREIVKMALSRKIPIHFVSTASVATQVPGVSEVGEVSLRGFPPLASTSGYVASKWASEIYLERVSHEYGVPITIHRPSYITAPSGSDSNSSGPSSLDLTQNIIHFSQKARTVPDLSSWTGYFDSISVGAAARTTIGAAVTRSNETNAIQYMYESGEVEIPIRYLPKSIMRNMGSHKWKSKENATSYSIVNGMSNASIVTKIVGKIGFGDGQDRFTVLPAEKWVDAVAQAGMNPLLVAYLRQSVASGQGIALPRLVRRGRFPWFRFIFAGSVSGVRGFLFALLFLILSFFLGLFLL